MWALGKFLGIPEGGAEAERITQPGLPLHEGYHAGRARVPEAVQRGGKQRHKKLAGYYGRRPEGGLGQTGRDRRAVLGSLLCRQWHGHLTQIGMAATRDEHPGWTVSKVWTGVQRRKVVHNDLSARSITGGDVGRGHGAELYRGGRLVPSETLKVDTMPRVWIGTHHIFDDVTPPPHAWN